jgi:hypothetical protein
MKYLVAASALLFLGSVGLAEAAGEAPAGPPTPAPEMGQLKIFEGRAQCTGTQKASPFGAEHATRGIARANTGLGGFWMTLRYDERKTKQNQNPVHVVYVLGYDAGAKQFVASGFDGLGGRISESAAGWEGDKLMLTGDYVGGGQKFGFRDTFTKTGDAGIDHLGELQGADGKWTTLNQQTCKR